MLFKQLCRACGYFPFTTNTKIILSEYLGLSVRQVERYIAGNPIHPSAKRLLEIKASGLDLEYWIGFSIYNDVLVTPNGEYWNKSDLLSFSLSTQRFKAPNILSAKHKEQWQCM